MLGSTLNKVLTIVIPPDLVNVSRHRRSALQRCPAQSKLTPLSSHLTARYQPVNAAINYYPKLQNFKVCNISLVGKYNNLYGARQFWAYKGFACIPGEGPRSGEGGETQLVYYFYTVTKNKNVNIKEGRFV